MGETATVVIIRDSSLLFPVDSSYDRIHSRSIVFGVEANGGFKLTRKMASLRRGK